VNAGASADKAQPSDARERRRRWPVLVTAVAVGAIVAGAISTLVTLQVTNSGPVAPPVARTVTVTVTAAPSSTQVPAGVSAAAADDRTCAGWHGVGPLLTAAADALGAIPRGMTIADPAVQTNPAWAAGVAKAGELYGQAAQTIAAQIAPGTSPMLGQIADTIVSALRTLSIAYKTYDPAGGNSMREYRATKDAMDVYCS
jgi:hypothetical protein